MQASLDRRHLRAGRRAQWTAGIALVAPVALAAWMLPACNDPPRGTRLVLVTLDTLRYDAVSGPAAAMPRLAAAGRDGATFARAYAASSSTQATHASLFTGLHPWQHGLHKNGTVLGGALTTVAETLQAAGWWTGAVVASFPLHSRFGLDQGFEVYDDDFSSRHALDQRQEASDDRDFYTPGAEVSDRALALLDAARGERQFLWVHYFDAHSPYGETGDEMLPFTQIIAAAKHRSPSLPAVLVQARQRYDQDVAYVDDALARLLQRLARDEDRFDTHVVITADHGESFGDDGSFGHGTTVSPAQVHVPLIVLSPRLRPGARDDAVGSVDIATTLLALAGLPSDGFGHGRDLCTPPSSGPGGPPAGAGPGVFGMRRTYDRPRDDVHVDGSIRQLQGTLEFYALLDGTIVTGNAQAVEDTDAARAEAGRRLFTDFQRELEARPASELLDADTQTGLEALGYVR